MIVKEQDGEIYLAEIQVLPNWQSQGIGASIIRSLIERATAANKPLTLRVLKLNPRARALYERSGFRHFREIETHTYLRWAPLDER